jgi:hypothetical protein
MGRPSLQVSGSLATGGQVLARAASDAGASGAGTTLLDYDGVILTASASTSTRKVRAGGGLVVASSAAARGKIRIIEGTTERGIWQFTQVTANYHWPCGVIEYIVEPSAVDRYFKVQFGIQSGSGTCAMVSTISGPVETWIELVSI